MAFIETVKGLIDEAELFKRTGSYDDPLEHCDWIEYWTDAESARGFVLENRIHRSAITIIKEGFEASSIIGKIV